MRTHDRITELMGSRRGEGAASPVRPSVPLLLVIGTSAWGACAALWPVLEGVAEQVCRIAGLASCAALLACVAVMFFFRGRVLVLCAVLGAFIGAAFAFAGAAGLHAEQRAFAAHPTDAAILIAVEDASRTPYGHRCLFDARFSDGTSGRIQAYLDEDDPVPLNGEAFIARIDPAAVAKRSSVWAWSQGQTATASLAGFAPVARDGVMGAILEVRERAIGALAGDTDAAAVLQALVCGFVQAYDETSAKQDFTVCGLAHIVAVSGAHLVIVSAFVSIVLQASRIPRGACLALQCLIMLGYLVLAGVPVSAVRAFFMTLVLQLSYVARRRGTGLSALGACIVVMMAADPKVAVSASFALSALSTLGIALFAPLLSFWIGRLACRALDVLRDALAMTLASAILAQPFSTALFSQLSLVSPLANIIVAPLVAPVCGCGIAAALAGACIPMLADPLISVASIGSSALCGIVSACASLPFASVPIALDARAGLLISALAAVALWLAWPLPRACKGRRRVALALSAAAAAVALAAPVAPWAKGDQLVMLDVGQGDAFLLSSGGERILIDTGAYDSLLRSALARQGVAHLDAVVITHADADHCGALASLRGVVEVERVIIAQEALACGCTSCGELVDDARDLVGDESVIGISRGDSFAMGAFALRVVWPAGFEEEGGNADSLCLLIGYDAQGDGSYEASVLMTGDAEAEQLSEIIAEEHLGGVDVLKVGHHGSKNAFDADQIAEISPTVALISVGEGNRYGHPAPEIVSLLEQEGAAVFRTDLQGDVSCKFSGDSITVGTLR